MAEKRKRDQQDEEMQKRQGNPGISVYCRTGAAGEPVPGDSCP